MSERLTPGAMRRLLDLARESGAEAPAAEFPADYGNKFRIVREVGRGGMGTVFEAVYRGREHMRSALKVLSAGELADFDLRERFAEEARVASRLAHPNIPRIYEIHRSYLAMQFIDGETLAVTDRGDRVRLVRLLRDACLAVHYAHQQGLVHRDLKPQNLMVTPEDQVFVMDFGLARRIHVGEVRGEGVVGTPGFMSPEQAAGDPAAASVASDVHALGATLFELLADRLPYAGATKDAVLQANRAGAAVSLVEVAPSTDRGLAAIVDRCLRRDPGERPETAYALSRELSAWLARFMVPGR